MYYEVTVTDKPHRKQIVSTEESSRRDLTLVHIKLAAENATL